MAVLGEPTDDEDHALRVKVFGREDGRWIPSAKVGDAVSSSSPMSFAISPPQTGEDSSAPCLGLTTIAKLSKVLCLVDGSWKDTQVPKAVQHSCQIVDLYSYADGLVALTQTGGPRKLILQAWQLDAEGWRPLGDSIKSDGGIGLLGQNSDPDAAPDIFLTGFGQTPERQVWSLHGERWHQSVPALKGPAMGPSTSGSVRRGEHVYVPVDVATAQNWPLSVFGYTPQTNWDQIGDNAVNLGPGSAQGGIDYAAGNVWVTWQQNDSTHVKHGLFPTRIYAQCLAPQGLRRETLLWDGLSIGPGSVQVIDAEGKEFALFMRSSRRYPHGLHATVLPVHC